MSLFASIEGKVLCYATLHSNVHEYLSSHDAGKAGHSCREDYITQIACKTIYYK